MNSTEEAHELTEITHGPSCEIRCSEKKKRRYYVLVWYDDGSLALPGQPGIMLQGFAVDDDASWMHAYTLGVFEYNIVVQRENCKKPPHFRLGFQTTTMM